MYIFIYICICIYNIQMYTYVYICTLSYVPYKAHALSQESYVLQCQEDVCNEVHMIRQKEAALY